MEIRTELKQVLRRLRLSGILFTLMERVSYARGQKLTYEEFLELVLSDEIERRDQGMIERRIKQGALDPDQTIERFQWDAPVTLDRDRVKGLFNLSFIANHENVIICGPVGVGNYAKLYIKARPIFLRPLVTKPAGGDTMSSSSKQSKCSGTFLHRGPISPGSGRSRSISIPIF